jgi:hypothetical protein
MSIPQVKITASSTKPRYTNTAGKNDSTSQNGCQSFSTSIYRYHKSKSLQVFQQIYISILQVNMLASLSALRYIDTTSQNGCKFFRTSMYRYYKSKSLSLSALRYVDTSSQNGCKCFSTSLCKYHESKWLPVLMKLKI